MFHATHICDRFFSINLLRTIVLGIAIGWTCASTINAHSIVFVHIGKQLPAYIGDALLQARLFNECSIYLVANAEAIKKYNPAALQPAELITIESLQKTAAHETFSKNSSLNTAFREGFWLYTSERFLCLYDFMQQYDLKDVVHLEGDVMLYADVSEFMPIFQKKYPGIGAAFDNDNRCIPSLVYVPNKDAMGELADCFAQYAKQGKNDMEVLAIFKNQNKNISALPIIMPSYAHTYQLKSPAGHVASDPAVYSNNFESFNSIFDAAALGQYIGGIDPRNGKSQPGFINESCVFNPSFLSFTWQVDNQGRNAPYMHFNNESYRINNLHIHCKDLRRFLSVK